MRYTMLCVAGVAVGAACYAASCSHSDDGCPWYEDFAPPSAKIALINGATNQPICKDVSVSVDRGPILQYEKLCQYWIPEWFPTDAGSALTLKVSGFMDAQLTFPAVEDRCGDLAEPPFQTVVLAPQPTPDAGVLLPVPPDAGVPANMDAAGDAGGDAGDGDAGGSGDVALDGL